MIGMLCGAFPTLLFYGVSVLILTGSGFTVREIQRDSAQQARHCSADIGDD